MTARYGKAMFLGSQLDESNEVDASVILESLRSVDDVAMNGKWKYSTCFSFIALKSH